MTTPAVKVGATGESPLRRLFSSHKRYLRLRRCAVFTSNAHSSSLPAQTTPGAPLPFGKGKKKRTGLTNARRRGDYAEEEEEPQRFIPLPGRPRASVDSWTRAGAHLRRVLQHLASAPFSIPTKRKSVDCDRQLAFRISTCSGIY